MRRVCTPASVSTFSVCSFSQVMCTRVGLRIRPAAPYARHEPSVAGSHELPTFVPSALSGTLAKSPFGGVTMRHRQSSVTTETQ